MKFSIIIPTYNRGQFIGNTISDVLNQNYENWELLIIDDGSIDNTKDVITPFTKNSKIQYIYQENAERSAARNLGIHHAKGDFICFVVSDERVNPDFLKLIAEGIKKYSERVGIYYYDIGFVSENNHKNIESIRIGRQIDKKNSIDDLMKIIIGVPQLCISRQILETNKFNPKINVGEDLELLARLFSFWNFYYISGKPQIFEIEHFNRSVELRSPSNLKNIETLRFIFSKPHPGNRVSGVIKRKKMSDAYLRGAYFYCFEKKRLRGISYLIKSIYFNPKKQLKHKANLILHLIFMPQNIDRII